MKFNNQIPDWKNTGTEPSSSLKNEGFQAGQKPPAGVFNWFFSLVIKAITELQGYVSRKELGGETVQPTSDTSVTAGTGAEISNDYRKRVFDEGGLVSTGNVASGNYSHAEGSASTASGNSSHSEGSKNVASGYASHAEGAESKATNYYAHAEGYQTEATASFTHTEGYVTVASGVKSHAEGSETVASGDTTHAEGNATVASGNYSHAEGSNTIATARCTHAEGYKTEATKDYAHAEGNFCIASGIASHAEGSKTESTAYYAHAEGGCTTVIGNYAHIEGYSIKKAKEVMPELSIETSDDAIIAAWGTDKFSLAKGGHSHCEGGNSLSLASYSHAEGKETIARGNNSHAEGYLTKAVGESSHSEGNATTASGIFSHSEGTVTTASGDFSHAEGYDTVASGNGSHAEGNDTEASGTASHSEGTVTTASGDFSHAEGQSTTASGYASHAEGQSTTASGDHSHAGGKNTQAKADTSFAHGYQLVANAYQSVFGKNNLEKTGASNPDSQLSTEVLFSVGYGTSNTKANALSIYGDGKCKGVSSFLSTGADIAEYFEWLDGNQKNEDRRGLFVTLDGEKIRLANAEDDYILGVISVAPSFVGDSQSEQWRGIYLTDIFGEKITETIEIEETTDESGKVIPAHTVTRFKLNPEYDPEKEYVSREFRKEWAAVGLTGKLVTVDDGTCKVNGYCTVNDNGKATHSDVKTPYRVMDRVDDTHIRIFVR